MLMIHAIAPIVKDADQGLVPCDVWFPPEELMCTGRIVGSCHDVGRSQLACIGMDFDVPTEIPNWSAISWCENPSITYMLNTARYDGGNFFTWLTNSLYKIVYSRC